MAIILAPAAASNPNPNGGSYTFSYTMPAGTDGLLFLWVCMANTTDFALVTFDGVPMDVELNYSSSSLSQRWAFFALPDANPGTHNVTISFTGSQFNPLSIYCRGMIGSSGIGTIGNNDLTNTPHSRPFNGILEGSYSFAAGVSTSIVSDIDIVGVSNSINFTHNTNRQVGGSFCDNPMVAGDTDVITSSSFGTISNQRIEFVDAGAIPGGDTGGFFLVL